MADHPAGYRKGCECERCERQRERARGYAKTYKHPNPTARRQYKTGKQREYEARPGKPARNKAWREANPDAVWGHSLKKAHGMRPEQWYAMWMEQGGNCYLCEQPLPDDRSKVAVDHDHNHCPSGRSCGHCRRGLTHHGCNTAIGLVGEDAALLRVIADNLERAKELTRALLVVAPEQGELELGV
jgi:hypothetical protein